MIFIFFLLLKNLICISNEKKLMIDSNGYIIMGKGDRISEVGSLSKMMIAFLILDKVDKKVIDLEDRIAVSNERKANFNKILKLNNKKDFSIKDILTALILFADNGAALELKNYIEVDENFLNLMNNLAQREQLYNTFFSSAVGYKEKNYSTAQDIGKLSSLLINNYNYINILNKAKKLQPDKNSIFIMRDDVIKNEIYPLASSYSSKEGYSLVAFSEVKGIKVIFVILNSEFAVNRDKEIQSMINHLSSNFEGIVIGRKDELVVEVPILGNKKNIKMVLEKDLVVTLPIQSNDPFKLVKLYPINYPVMKNEKLGEIEIQHNGRVIGKRFLVLSENLNKPNYLSKLISLITFKYF